MGGRRLKSWILATVLVTSLMGVGQINNRFPAPLGLDRILTGVVSKAKLRHAAKPSAARFVISSDGESYQLHGHEKELKRFLGKKVLITGNVVGENVTVNTVKLSRK